MDAEVWLRLKKSALVECRSGGWKDACEEMSTVSGIQWCDPGEPGQVPPTPATRDIDSFQRRLPRRLRRLSSRSQYSGDACGALEILGMLYDAYLEYQLTGLDEVESYLRHHAEVGYGNAVHRFIVAAHEWHVGLRDEAKKSCWLLALLLALLAWPVADPVTQHRRTARQRPPPLKERPT